MDHLQRTALRRRSAGEARDEEDVGGRMGDESMRYLVNANVCTSLVGILRRI